MVAFGFAVMPSIGAYAATTSADSIEEDHRKDGLPTWLLVTTASGGFNFSSTPGVLRVEGDGAYGYNTGLNPFNVGITGVSGNLGNDVGPVAAYAQPCPAFLDSNGEFVVGGCAANVDTDVPQSVGEGPFGTAEMGEVEIPILDDMLAKMRDYEGDNLFLTQTLDILFYYNPLATSTDTAGNSIGNGFYINQTLDQDMADMTGDTTSYFIAGDGIKQHLFSKFVMGNALTKGVSDFQPSWNTGDDADYVDQWLMSFTKDVNSTGNGIISSISSWVGLDRNHDSGCPGCTYQYDPGHDPVVKTVPQIDGHP
jgi:hypothetical protein